MKKNTGKITLSIVGLALCWLTFQVAFADDKPLTYDRVRLSASAGGDVENDTLVAILYSQKEGGKVSGLADEVNRAIKWGVERAKRTPEVDVQTKEHQTNPIYRKQVLRGWRVRQSFQVKSRNAAQLSKLLGKLQERLAIQSVHYDVSPEKRNNAENVLIANAIAHFKNRAELITTQFGRKNYRLVQMDVNTSNSQPRPMRMRAATMAMEAAVAPPSLEAGVQRVQVTATGTIELLLE